MCRSNNPPLLTFWIRAAVHHTLALVSIFCTIQLTNRPIAAGHREALTYQFETEPSIEPQSLEAASKHGKPECARLLLERGAEDTCKPGRAFIEVFEQAPQ
ncbi:hypothetical protein C8035_v008454 [Colletotrichum spinosum]|uniref:Uncharacterized protein n=1 Tax=Colletotrichum spinosum TaxID=1347390 RepID=A0A4R8QJN8_9PEZI|nr:hypothetical protein C8035_v008454 [Colletotrichum spinosum]